MPNFAVRIAVVSVVLVSMAVLTRTAYAQQFGGWYPSPPPGSTWCVQDWLRGGYWCEGYRSAPSQPQSRCPAGYYPHGSRCIANGHAACPGSDKSCPNTQVCYRVPYGVPQTGGQLVGCTTPAEAAELDAAFERVIAEHAAEQERIRAEEAARLAEEYRADEERREAERLRELRQQRERAEEAGRSLDRDTDRQVQRLTSASGEYDPESPEAIMRRLRANSVLDRLKTAEGRQQPLFSQQRARGDVRQSAPAPNPNAGQDRIVITRQPVVPNERPLRETPPGRNVVLPVNRETALLPSPALAEPRQAVPVPSQQVCVDIDGRTVCHDKSDSSWVQDFAIGGSTSPEKLPPDARARYDAWLEDQVARRYSAEVAARDREILQQCMSFGCSSQTRALLSPDAEKTLREFKEAQPTITQTDSPPNEQSVEPNVITRKEIRTELHPLRATPIGICMGFEGSPPKERTVTRTLECDLSRQPPKCSVIDTDKGSWRCPNVSAGIE